MFFDWSLFLRSDIKLRPILSLATKKAKNLQNIKNCYSNRLSKENPGSRGTFLSRFRHVRCTHVLSVKAFSDGHEFEFLMKVNQYEKNIRVEKLNVSKLESVFGLHRTISRPRPWKFEVPSWSKIFKFNFSIWFWRLISGRKSVLLFKKHLRAKTTQAN